MENAKKEIRTLPVLKKLRPDYRYATYIEAYGEVLGPLTEETFPIADEEAKGFKFYSKRSWDSCAHMEIVPTVVKKTEEEDTLSDDGSKIEVPHVKIEIHFVPAGEDYKYTSRYYYGDSIAGDPVNILTIHPEMQINIVKYPDSLFYPFMYYVEHGGFVNERDRQTVHATLRDYGKTVIESIELAPDAEKNPEFMKWFQEVGQSLAKLPRANVVLDMIMQDELYIVYGDFDYATRKNRLEQLAVAEEDDDNENDD